MEKERELSICKYRVASGTAMKTAGIMILLSSHSPLSLFLRTEGITQWGQPGENHGEVRFLWSWSAASHLMISRQSHSALLLRGVEDKYEQDIVLKKELVFFGMPVPCTYMAKGDFADVKRRLGISAWRYLYGRPIPGLRFRTGRRSSGAGNLK